MRSYVAVIGPGDPDAEAEATAFEVGGLLAQRGAVVVTGGLGGTMEAACKGAKGRGGTTLALLPGLDRAEANPFVDLSIPTGMGEARNTLIVRTSDAVIAIGGGFGTLSEIGFALKTGKLVVGLRTWRLEDGAGRAAEFPEVESPAEAVKIALG